MRVATDKWGDVSNYSDYDPRRLWTSYTLALIGLDPRYAPSSLRRPRESRRRRRRSRHASAGLSHKRRGSPSHPSDALLARPASTSIRFAQTCFLTRNAPLPHVRLRGYTAKRVYDTPLRFRKVSEGRKVRARGARRRCVDGSEIQWERTSRAKEAEGVRRFEQQEFPFEVRPVRTLLLANDISRQRSRSLKS